MGLRRSTGAFALALGLALTGCAAVEEQVPAASDTAEPAVEAAIDDAPTEQPDAVEQDRPESDVVTLVSVVDGDTVETGAGSVRLIGIDSPERGQCGYDEATAAIGLLVAAGDPVTLGTAGGAERP